MSDEINDSGVKPKGTHGGPRANSGRKVGSQNKATILKEEKAQEVLEKCLSEGITPLEYMLKRLRTEPKPDWSKDLTAYPGEPPSDFMKRKADAQERYEQYERAHEADRMDAAKNAAPYVHPKLAQIEHKGNVKLAHEVALAELE